jgi:hypothetical protein
MNHDPRYKEGIFQGNGYRHQRAGSIDSPTHHGWEKAGFSPTTGYTLYGFQGVALLRALTPIERHQTGHDYMIYLGSQSFTAPGDLAGITAEIREMIHQKSYEAVVVLDDLLDSDRIHLRRLSDDVLLTELDEVVRAIVDKDLAWPSDEPLGLCFLCERLAVVVRGDWELCQTCDEQAAAGPADSLALDLVATAKAIRAEFRAAKAEFDAAVQEAAQ